MPEYPADLQVEVNAAVGVGAAAITAKERCLSILIQADPDNTDDIFVGDSAAQPIQLLAGGSMTLGITDPRKIFAKSASGTQTLNLLLEI